jgi:hypothetical protein
MQPLKVSAHKNFQVSHLPESLVICEALGGIASPNKIRHSLPTDTKEARLLAARRFVKGSRVRHHITGLFGSFVEINYGFALPEVWVQFDSDTEIRVPMSCNPLDLELVLEDCHSPLSIIAPEVVQELTEQEERDRHRLELRVSRAFYEAGTALRELRDRRLYRSTHKTFEEYCRERFGFARQSANYLIAGADVFENLTTNGCQILPTCERQVRPLTKIEPDQQWKVWQQAVAVANGKVPSGRVVKGIVKQLGQKPLIRACDFGRVGDVFTLTGLVEAERRYNGCPCVVLEVNEFTLKVDIHDATLTVKPDNLNSLDSPEVCRQLPGILKRIKLLRQCDLDRGAYPVLEALGRQTYLTDLEAKLLTFLEQEYEIND